MGRRIGIGRKLITALVIISNYDEMKYPVGTINLIAGINVITTTITTPIYSIFILDSVGADITYSVDKTVAVVGGVYVVYITSGIDLNNVQIYLLY